jgi:mannose-6-phosphate isomerase-like protein (cupin superfamily)
MNSGEFVNEKSSAQSQVDVWNGLVMMMPKDESYLLRNVGKENLELLLIEVRKRPLLQLAQSKTFHPR